MRLFSKQGQVALDPGEIGAAALRKNVKFKIHCRRYDEGDGAGGTMLLRSPANYRDYAKMVEALRGVIELTGESLTIAPELAGRYADMRELAEEHFRLGNEIKRGDAKHDERLREFAGVVDSAMVRSLKDRQMRDAFFMASMRRAGNFSVPGSGKTATVLGAFAFLAARGLVSRLLVVCPKNAFDSWRTEWRLCFGERRPLACFSSQDARFKQMGRGDRRIHIRAGVGGCNLLLVNYEATPAIAAELAALAGSGTLLVFDEVHRVKRVNGTYAAACLEIAQGAPATFALTGTPLPNTYEDLYNFLHILYPREYDSFFGFDRGELKNAGEAEQQAINERMQPFYCRTTKTDLGVPPAERDELVHVDADSGSCALLDMLFSRYRNNKLVLLVRLLQMESDPAMLLTDLDPDSYRWLLDEDDETGEIDVADYSEEIVEAIGRAATRVPEKRRACCALVAELVEQEHRSVIVWCVFKRSMRAIRRDLAARGIDACVIDGDVVLDDRDALLNDFRAGRFKVLITNPHTLAESVSLHMVCHDAVYFEYSFNLVHLLQSKDRIHRLGLEPGQRTRYYFLMQDYLHKGQPYSMDGGVYARLLEKEETMMRAIESGLIETQPTTEEDLQAIFEGLFE